jgi:CelD/BcsL family acetyltransferase involved in cellulose biosynthesis
MRYKFRKNRRELEKHGTWEFRTTSSQDELDRDFLELMRLHNRRWEGRGMSGVFVDRRFVDFLRMAAGYMLENRHLRLSLVSVSGQPVGAVMNVVYANKVYYYQSGFDTDFDKKVAIGTFVHSLCVESAIDEKLTEYDFLLKGSLDEYKERWTKAHREISDMHLVSPGPAQWIDQLAIVARSALSMFRSLRERSNLSGGGSRPPIP